MKHEDFLKLKSKTIAPNRVKWPEPTTFHHWQKLHAAVDTARDAVVKAHQQQDAIEASRELTDQGKRKRRADAALEAINALNEDKSIARAREAVESVNAMWRSQIDKSLAKPADAHEVALHQEIRTHFAGLKPHKRLEFINVADKQALAALTLAPAYLTGLSKEELALASQKVEALALDPEAREAKAATEVALDETEKGWRTAERMIAERGNLIQGMKGGWEARPEAR